MRESLSWTAVRANVALDASSTCRTCYRVPPLEKTVAKTTAFCVSFVFLFPPFGVFFSRCTVSERRNLAADGRRSIAGHDSADDCSSAAVRRDRQEMIEAVAARRNLNSVEAQQVAVESAVRAFSAMSPRRRWKKILPSHFCNRK